MDEKIIVSSLALDLRRIAQGLNRGSFTSAKIFIDEALKRGNEIENFIQDHYLRYLWSKTKKILLQEDVKSAEDILMYSILFQNFAVKKMG